MAIWTSISTERLVLTRPTVADLDELFELHADPRVWEHYPALRHDGPEQTQGIIAAARRAARQLRPGLPVIAYLLEDNVGSRRASERAGLELVWRGHDSGNPDPAAIRLIYADRTLDNVTLRALINSE